MASICINKREMASIPVLEVVQRNVGTKSAPTVIYYHGFTSAKEHNLDTAFLLAEKGYRVILPDSLHHGERESGLTNSEKNLAFWDIIIQNVKELEELYGFLMDNNMIEEGRIGIAGTSMGGITTASALRLFPWIKCAAVLMGSPMLEDFTSDLISKYKEQIDIPISEEEIEKLYNRIKPYDLSKDITKLNHRPLLFWHGENDSVVPYRFTQDFYNHVNKQYNYKENIRLISEKNRDHKVSRFAKLETVKWFEKHL